LLRQLFIVRAGFRKVLSAPMNNACQPIVASDWDCFRRHWAGPRNFMLRGPCVPFADFAMPPLDRVIAELSADDEVSIGPGSVGRKLISADYRDEFRKMPLEQAMEQPFALAHYRLSKFDAPGRFLHGFGARVLDRWKGALAAAGFTFERCYPIIFISGRHCATNYHMDFSHVLAWQIYGTKHFCGLTDPDRWAPRDVRLNYNPGEFAKPEELTDADTLCYTMRPGDALWNVLLTPHWVNAGDDEIAMSVNLSHGGVRLRGELSPNERELEDYRSQHPDKAPAKVAGRY
jgi:hypothetical protein